MKAVWSFWTKPYLMHHNSRWPSDRHHLLAWALSVETARQHYPDTWLVTDDAGARMLVDNLGLPFTYVSTELNALAMHDPDWWNLGKVYAYHLQTEPFVHIDSDVFLWKRLPARLEGADVLAQNPNPLSASTPYYQPEQLERTLRPGDGGWLPDEWHWYRHSASPQRAEACGIVGGNRTDLLRSFAEAALRIVCEPRNQRALQSLPAKRMHCLLIEEYLLAAFVEYQRVLAAPAYDKIQVEYLFHSDMERWDPNCAAEAGYTHLVAGAKRNPRFADLLARHVRRDYPELYERCCRIAAQSW
jgi:hypothetical protein